MKTVVIGGTGLVGTEIVKLLGQDHDVIAVGRTSGDLQVDIESKDSIKALFEKVGPVDAIVVAAGDGVMGRFDDESDHAYDLALKSKVMGQVNVVRVGHKYLKTGGSITLTSGSVAKNPMPNTAAIAAGVGAIDAFVATVALELEEEKRINAISLSLVKESAEKFGMDSSGCVPASDVSKHYQDCITGSFSGQVRPVKN
ncbi:short chain dehydrogenase [Labrenzia sp. PHM005]|uniref:short chain dehydrogenase n=1 Tax=Labrenzia sp. PHM005 TaxID=2590016 RepID=UPI0011403256|nr:short chain dehydrogenase [Labrenzia sp. PHM005]QDG74645.1 short chain dehydrogenase [Labrenzia sp. PHM005]